ncbi:MAG: hypothetical protein A2340_02485 [Lentisphaerae bacterium RIFOXYB12_FULL_60_10]|nr:MAG: hypothetical protein A2340_02485 [Lentisphaerae bacterium RIFOXYB12_FULL_60_10]
MSSAPIESLLLIAGNGVYPRLLAESARRQGVKRIVTFAFRHETDRAITSLSDTVHWIYIGQLEAMLTAMQATGIHQAVMAGQITPTHLFSVRLDSRARSLLKPLAIRNAETIFGAVADELASIGIRLIPASSFMEAFMPAAGILTHRPPSPDEQSDMDFGFRIAKATSALDIGQTVVVKQGTVVAVEAFEGTDQAIRRARKLAGPGTVVIKVAKPGHDMRFDIPVIGRRTLITLRKAQVRALAFEAGRAILLERDAVVKEANRMDLCLAALSPAKTEPST